MNQSGAIFIGISTLAIGISTLDRSKKNPPGHVSIPMTKETHNLACNDWHNDPPPKKKLNQARRMCFFLKKMRLFFQKSFVTIRMVSTDLPPSLLPRKVMESVCFICRKAWAGTIRTRNVQSVVLQTVLSNKKKQQVDDQSFRWIGWGGGSNSRPTKTY